MGTHRVVFRATPALKSWKHRNGGLVAKDYDDGRRVKVMVPPDILADGDEREVDDFDAGWLTVNYPDNFSEVGAKPAPADEPEGDFEDLDMGIASEPSDES